MILNLLINIFIFLFGLCIGSFLNCMVYRVEEEKSINGRSFCPHCKHILSWQDLFPLLSFLFLRGKCRYCHKKISIQYPLVELATGILFLLIFNPQNILQSIFYLIVSIFLIIIFIYDLKHYLIPEVALFPAIIITIIYNLIPPYNGQYLLSTILATLIASGVFFLIFWISKEKAMGFGDVELVFLMGILLGFPNVLVALFLAFFFGAIIGLMLMLGQNKSLKSAIPFGPFLIAGTFIAMLHGNQIISWYLNFFII